MRVALLCLLLSGCGFFGGGSKPDPGNPVAIASCPKSLPAQTGDNFGDTVNKLIEISGIYFKCRAAAVGAEGGGK